ncbi:hypothetical protein M2459_000326 [Parabacteroides sp. PF5-5]|uniref:hypothetical protein n=1 Tax=unclassified Parabacteroides TaxID=2649774 RepID=UPI002476D2B8|nr:MULTISPECIES: hypothetical protein [unclassified Parabacteroides]MDH6306339.1 hypothetical protein [Parabacteroides sp. PH5-39]MDH6314611.1 hypothetical protein [Parabacteroides sp. PF5-13]MDH6321050.1 hypothetical protein [Parabacteroides sp. PH5-13]MDH6324782.1 hypothetical protein [Parabacteroides sp. PH5-8]MDH6325537.1 hypothetical protein [Parabacteroides sp. PH5-41]
MNRLYLLIIYIVLPFCLIAQQQTEYNRKGDEAMKRLDYSDARLFYGEGVPNCDLYSINQLTTIWLANEQMRSSMHNQMSRCFNCLSVKALENDSIAISKLIIYYTEGIGTPKSDEWTTYWEERLEELRNPPQLREDYSETKPSRPSMNYFAGYTYSTQMPIGITVGGVGERFGWYARFKTNASFQSFDEEFSGDSPKGASAIGVSDKKSAYAVTAGMLYKCNSRLYLSAGAGYGKRDLLWQFAKVDDNGDATNETKWYKKTDDSYNGVAVDLDCMFRIGVVYLSAGCSTINFKYVDLNAGIGVFF